MSRREFKEEVSKLAHQLVQIDRSVFFGIQDRTKWLPKYQLDNAKVMCPPFVGKNYSKGGLLLLGINPGGGGERAKNINEGDQKLYPIIKDFKKSKDEIYQKYWSSFASAFREVKPTWDIYPQHIEPVLNASEVTLDEICYLNVLQYRSRDDKYPDSISDMNLVIKPSFENFVKPFIKLVAPSMVVCLGKQVDKYIKNYWATIPCKRLVWNRSRALKPEVIIDREDCVKNLKLWNKSYKEVTKLKKCL